MTNRFENFGIGPSHDTKQYYPDRNLLKATGFELFAKKLQSDPYVLFLITSAMSKIPTVILCRTPEGTIMPSLKPVSPVVSEDFLKNLYTT